MVELDGAQTNPSELSVASAYATKNHYIEVAAPNFKRSILHYALAPSDVPLGIKKSGNRAGEG